MVAAAPRVVDQEPRQRDDAIVAVEDDDAALVVQQRVAEDEVPPLLERHSVLRIAGRDAGGRAGEVEELSFAVPELAEGQHAKPFVLFRLELAVAGVEPRDNFRVVLGEAALLDEAQPGGIVVDFDREPLRATQVRDGGLPELGADAGAPVLGVDADPDAALGHLTVEPVEVRRCEADDLVPVERDPRSLPRPGRQADLAVAKRIRGLHGGRGDEKQELRSPLRVARLEWAHARHSATLGARGAIAQLGERLDRTQEVVGSSPTSSIA